MTKLNASNQRTVRVSGQAETKQAAFASALSKIQKELVADTAMVTLQIQPLQVTPVSLQVAHRTERFLWLFFPRQRTQFSVTIDVTVQVNAIDLNTVVFATTPVKRNPLLDWTGLRGGK
ncbi:DUF4312 family protein [Lactiplantibacillus songbeiensis]|uniref:DUF4312 family protein n=1 Tax=Lactiplantibacillus songbeiensis TaxID=2559920 RepID=A0ABW4C5J8_9LACO|nr:DUF4312 family protein [Lactiplantibacillus songbeiensis]